MCGRCCVRSREGSCTRVGRTLGPACAALWLAACANPAVSPRPDIQPDVAFTLATGVSCLTARTLITEGGRRATVETFNGCGRMLRCAISITFGPHGRDVMFVETGRLPIAQERFLACASFDGSAPFRPGAGHLTCLE